MDINEFLTEVPSGVMPESTNEYQVLDLIEFFDFDAITKKDIVLCNIAPQSTKPYIQALGAFRNHFYQLSKSNWDTKIFDLGTIIESESQEDTSFAVHQIAKEIAQREAVFILLGGAQLYSYIVYQALQKDLVKFATIDLKLDIQGNVNHITAENFVTHMILNENYRLLDYFNLGSQAPYVAKEELDIVEQLNFENIRLGKLTENITLAEPYLREIDLLSIDTNALQFNNFVMQNKPTPNGFNSREICSLVRYAGLNKNLKNVHIANFFNDLTLSDSSMLAEMLWYFIEAQNNQKSESDIQTYRVQLEEQELVFYKSVQSERWWIEVSVENKKRNLPCSEQDYQEALQGNLPDIWLKFYKKFY